MFLDEIGIRFRSLFFQIVYLTFDDALTALAEELYHRGIFNGTYKNPDGCAIRGTHFISARANDYSLVSKQLCYNS